MELSKPIRGFEDFYNISESGIITRNERRIKRGDSFCLIKAKELNQCINSVGYKVINFKIEGKSYYNLVHRLVAINFIDNPLGYDLVNHIDHNKLNNHFTNLEWVNRRENYSHWANTQEQTSKHTGVHFDKKTKKWAAAIRLGELKRLGEFSTEQEAANAYLFALNNLNLQNKYALI